MKRVRWLVGVLLIAIVLFGIIYAKTIINNRVIVTIESPEKANLFIFALYPDGFRNIGKCKVLSGKTDIAIYLGDLRQTWMREYEKNGTLSQPLILLVAVSKDKVAISGVNFDWDNLKSKSVKLKFKQSEELKKLISRLNSKDIHTLDDLYWSIEDYYEYTLPVILSYVTPDSSSWGTMDYYYAINRKVGFSVNVFISSWSIAGYNIIQKNNYGSATASFPRGDDYYIWMNVRYRYEKWVMYLDDEPISTMELVFVKDLYPHTMTKGTSKPSNALLPEIDSWNYKGKYTSTRSDYPYYEFSTSNFGTNHFAIDCMKFIEILKWIGKISGKAATAASVIGLFVDVNFKYDNVEAFYFSIRLYSNPSEVHYVWLAESEAITSAPQIYVDVD